MTTLTGILLYVLLQLLLGLIVSKRIKSEEDFLLAGRSLGYGLATFSIFATWFGAESCIGASGAAFAHGLAGVTADTFGYSLCILFMGFFFAARLWKMKLTTAADFFRRRYGASVERLTALLMIPTSLLWAAAQIRAFGQVLSASSDMELTIAITMAAAVVILYTALGGLLADAITDFVQGGILVIGLLGIFAAVLNHFGDLPAAAAAVEESRLSFIPAGAAPGIPALLSVAEAWAVPVFGSLIAQEMVSRVLASRSHRVARRSAIMAGCMYLAVGLMPVFIGLAGKAILPGIDDPEHVLPRVARLYLSPILYILFTGALVSAILSTVDSSLLAVSALISHNLVPLVLPAASARQRLLINRTGVVVMGVLAYVLAMYGKGVYHLVHEASAFGSAGLFVIFIAGMAGSRGGKTSAIAALAAGALVWIVSEYLLHFQYSYLLSLLLSAAAFLMFLSVRPKGR